MPLAACRMVIVACCMCRKDPKQGQPTVEGFVLRLDSITYLYSHGFTRFAVQLGAHFANVRPKPVSCLLNWLRDAVQTSVHDSCFQTLRGLSRWAKAGFRGTLQNVSRREISRGFMDHDHQVICRVPKQCPAVVAELIERCQERKPADRPTAPQVLDCLISLQMQGALYTHQMLSEIRRNI